MIWSHIGLIGGLSLVIAAVGLAIWGLHEPALMDRSLSTYKVLNGENHGHCWTVTVIYGIGIRERTHVKGFKLVVGSHCF